MATKRMLIDATHPEETRVVVLNGNRLEEFDVEAAHRKQLKGNIYLAKVTRVEPSLQAAFVDYGGNRHGFLAFNEIHPDYYQIPVADRQALLAEQEAAEKADEAKDPENGEAGPDVETVGGDDAEEVEARRPAPPAYKRYKIQEVIKRRQILLVQVVKEERGNKGAALTTYISLAGRYCVLMPNTARGGGVSRKIGSGNDRKRLKNILSELQIPEGMAVIVRTAGAERTKAEIKRDYEYLLRLWDNIRELTLKSTAPTLIYEEGNLIKRSIRDLYGNDIDEIVVEGEQGYRTAKDFMRLLIPSHAKRVQPYRDPTIPLFHRYQVESQLDAMHSSTIHLKSGGYLVINPTEALVAIDVNSGKSTRERNIEETALKTNLEAASEVARQLRLRDLAGLIVIDFIDMEVNRNQTQVERRLKEALRSDRARIQVGRISPFGLLEMSRQRLRPGLHETAFEPCPHCEGTGTLRSTESSALCVLRALEEEGIRRRSAAIMAYVPTEIALYVLNQKREHLAEIERRYDFTITVTRDDSLIQPAYRLERMKAPADVPGSDQPITVEAEPMEMADEPAEEAAAGGEAADEEENGKRGKRRRRGRRRKKSGDAGETQTAEAAETEEAEEKAAESADADGEGEGDSKSKRRRRGRRGGRRRSRSNREQAAGEEEARPDEASASDTPAPETPAQVGAEMEGAGPLPEADEEAAPELLGAPQAPGLLGQEHHELLDKPETMGDGQEAVIYAGAPQPDVIYGEAPAPEVIYAGEGAEAGQAGETEPEPEAEKPKRKRPSRSRGKAKTEASADAEEEAETPKKKPARRRSTAGKTKAKAETPEADTSEAETADAGEPEADTAAKPKKKAPARSRSRKTTGGGAKGKTAAKESKDEAKEAEPAESAESGPPEAEPAEQPTEAAKTTVIDVGGDSAAEEAPRRTGWWRR